jgi:DNA-binding response OmpR family regulator
LGLSLDAWVVPEVKNNMGPVRDRNNHQQPFYRDEHLFVDLCDQLVILDSQPITLTHTEYRLLALLAERTGEIVPPAILLMHIWGYGPEVRTRTVGTHIQRLRKKLGKVGRSIETVMGVGYRFRPPFPLRDQGLSSFLMV